MVIEELSDFLSQILPAKQDKIPFEIGKSYFIRTASSITAAGKVKEIVGKFLILEDASVKDESVETCILNTDMIVDAFPREQ